MIEISKKDSCVEADVYVDGHWWKTITTEPKGEIATMSEVLNCVEHSLNESTINFEK